MGEKESQRKASASAWLKKNGEESAHTQENGVDERNQSSVTQHGLGAMSAQEKCAAVGSDTEEGRGFYYLRIMEKKG